MRCAFVAGSLLLLVLTSCAPTSPVPPPQRADARTPIVTSVAAARPNPTPTVAIEPQGTANTGSRPALDLQHSPEQSWIRLQLRDAITGAKLPCAATTPSSARIAVPTSPCAVPRSALPLTLSAPGYEPLTITTVPALDLEATLSPQAMSVAQAFVAALQGRQWRRMWEYSHPLARRRWPNEHDFTAFLEAKFAPAGRSTITSAVLGKASVVSKWQDQRVVESSVSAVRIPVKLTLAHDAPYASPPSDLQDSADLYLVRDGAVWKVVDGGPADLLGPVLVPVHPAARTVPVPILMYHHIAPAPVRSAFPSDYDYRLDASLTVTPGQFERQLDWLQEHGFQSIAPQQLMAALYQGAPLPVHPVLLTFDDGYLDNAIYAAPVLERHHMTATFNIVTGFVGTHGALRYMSWAQIAGLAGMGMEIGSHTVYHRDLGKLLPLDAWGELITSQETLTRQLGHSVQFLCYPSGEPFKTDSLAARQRLLHFVPKAGYVAAFLDQLDPSVTQSATHPDQLPRLRVAGGETLASFSASITRLAER